MPEPFSNARAVGAITDVVAESQSSANPWFMVPRGMRIDVAVKLLERVFDNAVAVGLLSPADDAEIRLRGEHLTAAMFPRLTIVRTHKRAFELRWGRRPVCDVTDLMGWGDAACMTAKALGWQYTSPYNRRRRRRKRQR